MHAIKYDRVSWKSLSEIASSRASSLQAKADVVVASPVFAYGAIVLLQLRIIWDIWRYKDLTSGDTAGYFLDAASWAHGLHDDIVWSPLYTDFLGSITAAFKGNIYAAVITHRVVIVVAAAVLVLALMRSLLGPAVGLLVAVWWVVVPANFNVLYEVHLFGVLPLLLATLVVIHTPSRSARGIVLALLFATTLLLRNELLIATLLVGMAIIVHERRGRRVSSVQVSVYARAFGVPLIIACLLAGALYWRSFDQGHDVTSALRTKTGLNVCQSYAFNYQQRHPTKFVGNAFTECQPLLKQVFGHGEPTLLQATLADPRAVGAYVLWNGRLLASGLQVALFNATSTGDQPDYPPVETHRSYALVLSIVMLALLIGGGWIIRDEPGTRRREWLKRQGWAIVVLGAVAITTLVVVLTERPRPEYMYGMTVGVMALAGASLLVLLRRVNGTRFVAPAAIGLTLALLISVPSYYHKGPRPLHDAVERLEVIRSKLQRQGSVLIASGNNFEICAYLAATHSRDCTSPSWRNLQAQLARGVPIREVLSQVKATAIYADPLLLSNASIAKLVAAPAADGWRQVAAGTGESGPWHVLVRTG